MRGRASEINHSSPRSPIQDPKTRPILLSPISPLSRTVIQQFTQSVRSRAHHLMDLSDNSAPVPGDVVVRSLVGCSTSAVNF